MIYDSSGKKIKTVTVTSSRKSVSAPSFALNKAGTYKVVLSVSTSVGVKTDPVTCEKEFTISPPEVCPYNPQLPPSSPDCQPCPDNPQIWIKDDECSANIINTKTATNITRGNVDATKSVARAGDKISYTVTVTNRGLAPDTVTIREELKDVLEYSTLFDPGGGNFDQNSLVLQWPNVTVEAGEQQSRTFVVQMMADIPLTNTGVSDEASYDCRMVNTFGNSVAVDVDCALEKEIVEQTVSELPHTGPGENMIFAGTLLAIVTFFYARSRQLGAEVRLVRKHVHAGTI